MRLLYTSLEFSRLMKHFLYSYKNWKHPLVPSVRFDEKSGTLIIHISLQTKNTQYCSSGIGYFHELCSRDRQRQEFRSGKYTAWLDIRHQTCNDHFFRNLNIVFMKIFTLENTHVTWRVYLLLYWKSVQKSRFNPKMSYGFTQVVTDFSIDFNVRNYGIMEISILKVNIFGRLP